MVYNFSKSLKSLLQSRCLLCGCTVKACDNEASFQNQDVNCQRPSLAGTGHNSALPVFRTPYQPAIPGLCDTCYNHLPHSRTSCFCCGLPLTQTLEQQICGHCLKKPPHFTQTVTALNYEGEACRLIQQLKTQSDNASCYILAETLCHAIQRQYSTAALAQIDRLIPTPMFWQRNLRRGNNHAQLLAHTVSKTLNIPLYNNTLERCKYSLTQKGLNALQRRQNIKGAFRVKQALRACSIAVIDDVMTTGSTLNEIAYTLKRAGAKEVHAWAACRVTKAIK